ncbi:head-tail connector protein [Schinkia azotoformans]|uniref:hypothetical protein n=1 Tax=Schinkia azotoformans TaxID=1454 RepID=UPI002DBBA37C|nr:hypothetical protein [Schinkia azotoformans]MEC1716611.1 hypothetical protein [Schinkia azotoformans]MEC1739449.1 hypothetical protein [Schinkia azotoformans]MEC1745481.1 hypothetical protein [Schinkia azotoformans]MEC1756544.1 hypothetical protein [Schinkia azotoformans]MEC1765811.1 hypothetical protein [Schinkia azotoformans]
MGVLEIVKEKLPNSQLTDNALQVYIDEVGQSIKTYCNRSDIPSELTFVHANMVVDLIKGDEKKAAPGDNQVVTSIKEGDTQVSYGGMNMTLGETVVEDILHNYKKQLNKFRKMRW